MSSGSCNKTLGELKVRGGVWALRYCCCCNKTLGELKGDCCGREGRFSGRCNKTLGELKGSFYHWNHLP